MERNDEVDPGWGPFITVWVVIAALASLGIIAAVAR